MFASMNVDTDTSADVTVVDLSESAGERFIEAALLLEEPQSRLRLRLPPGQPGRAEAIFAGRSWAAKHYWQEGAGIFVYEFDEPLPAGSVTLRIPLSPA
jgi:hypothetical protein